ncbi:hypothetical protein PLESTM_000168700 [Pleodorina starrii]|nr:hypothetical protein PLESTM_000168700 [Pleodorina starrii]
MALNVDHQINHTNFSVNKDYDFRECRARRYRQRRDVRGLACSGHLSSSLRVDITACTWELTAAIIIVLCFLSTPTSCANVVGWEVGDNVTGASWQRRQAARDLTVSCGLRPSLPTYSSVALERSPREAVVMQQSANGDTDDPMQGSLTAGDIARAASATAAGTQPERAASLSVLGLAETAMLPLLRQHASGNTSWLRQLEVSAAAGESLPPQLMVPPPGKPGGPAAAPLLLLYRRDWWRALLAAGSTGRNGSSGSAGATAEEQYADAAAALPPTWPMLAQLASELINRDLDGDGKPDHVLCLDLMPGCKGWALLSAIYASMVQTNGTQQGVWYAQTNFSSTLGGPSLPTALRLYADLAASNAAAFTPGGSNVSRSTVSVFPAELLAGGGAVDAASGAPLCGAVNPLFAAGRCLFTVDWAAAALRLTPDGAPGISGRLAAALLPGSAFVQDTGAAATGQGRSFPTSAATTNILAQASSASAGQSLGAGLLRACGPTSCWGPQGRLPGSAPNASSETAVPAAGVIAAAVAGQEEVFVNVAPFVGEATNVWLLPSASRWDLRKLLLAGDFTEHVGYELDLKYGILTNSTPDIREFNGARATILALREQRQQQQQAQQAQPLQLWGGGDDNGDVIIALSSSLRQDNGSGPACTNGLLSMLAAAAAAAAGGTAAAEHGAAEAAAVLNLDTSDLLFVSQASGI